MAKKKEDNLASSVFKMVLVTHINPKLQRAPFSWHLDNFE
jgi:hypothetical protein